MNKLLLLVLCVIITIGCEINHPYVNENVELEIYNEELLSKIEDKCKDRSYYDAQLCVDNVCVFGKVKCN